METMNDPTTLYICSTHNPTWNPPIVTNPCTSNNYHVSEYGQSKTSLSPSGLVPQKWRQPSLLPTPTSDESPQTYELRSVEGQPTTPQKPQGCGTTIVSRDASPSGMHFSIFFTVNRPTLAYRNIRRPTLDQLTLYGDNFGRMHLGSPGLLELSVQNRSHEVYQRKSSPSVCQLP